MDAQNPDFSKSQEASRIAYLITGYLQQNLTAAEEEELNIWRNQGEDNRKLFADLTNPKQLGENLTDYANIDVEYYLERSKASLSFPSPSKKVRFWPYLAAASLLGLLILTYYLFPSPKREVAQGTTKHMSADIAPGNIQATLMLDNGRVIALGPGTRDTIINHQTKVTSGELVYNESPQTAAARHELTVPPKGFYKLKLPDGTVVWLNSASSIRYPVSFEGIERRVRLTGEAFFEVSHDEQKPFFVEAGGMVIEDLGTAFNVNTYENEPQQTATLVEGRVEVKSQKLKVKIKPGEQALLTNSELKVKTIENMEEVTAWKDGNFRFINTPLKTIMRQVERWYGAKVVYQDEVSVHFNGTIERDVPVSKLLSLLEKTNAVHFNIEGNKITVSR